MEKCPSCNRVFYNITDFPKIHLLEFLRTNSEDIPKNIHGTKTINLFEENEHKAYRVPNNVLRYFRQNPDKREMVTSKYIYTFHPEKDAPYANKDIYRRRLNYTTIIKKLLSDNLSLKKYFGRLESIVGKTIPMSRLFPNWEKTLQMGSIGQAYIIPKSKADTGDNNNQLVLGFTEDKEDKRNNCRECDVSVFYGGGPCFNNIKVGDIKYKGVLQKSK